ncbi:MAG: hypothetical protein Q7J16_06645 [Candidatus Cloacimonadales bacterium]|nr:hypothetical protein [Candidatus Cloacimonadales bacterium]
MPDQINPTITLAELYEEQNQLIDALLIYQKIKSRNPSEKLEQKIEVLKKKIFAKNPENYNPIIDKIFSPEDKTRFKILSHTQYQAFLKSQKISVEDDLPPLGKNQAQIRLPEDKIIDQFIGKTAITELETEHRETEEMPEPETFGSQLPYIDDEELEKIKSAEKDDKLVQSQAEQIRKEEKRDFLYDADDRDGHSRDDFFTTPFEVIQEKSEHKVDLSAEEKKDKLTEPEAEETVEIPEISEEKPGKPAEVESEFAADLSYAEAIISEEEIHPAELQTGEVAEEAKIEEINFPANEEIADLMGLKTEQVLLPEDVFDLKNVELEELTENPEEPEPVEAEAEVEVVPAEPLVEDKSLEELEAELKAEFHRQRLAAEKALELEEKQEIAAEVDSFEETKEPLEDLESELKAEFQKQRRAAEKALDNEEDRENPADDEIFTVREELLADLAEPESEAEKIEPAAFQEDKITPAALEDILKSNQSTFEDSYEPEPEIEPQFAEIAEVEEPDAGYSQELMDDLKDLEPENQEMHPSEPVIEETQSEKSFTDLGVEIEEESKAEIISQEQTVEDDLSYEDMKNIEPIAVKDIISEEPVAAVEAEPFLPEDIMDDLEIITPEEIIDDFQTEPELDEEKTIVDFGIPESEYLPITKPPKDEFFAASFDSILKRFAPDEEEEIAALPEAEPVKNEEKLEDLNFQVEETADKPKSEDSSKTTSSNEDDLDLSFDNLMSKSQADFRTKDIGFKAEDIIHPKKKKKK